MKPMDVHSYSRPDQVRVRHLDLDLTVNFDRKTIEGVATAPFRPHLRRRAHPRHSRSHDPLAWKMRRRSNSAPPIRSSARRSQIRLNGSHSGPDPLLHVAGRFRFAVARTRPDRGQAASVPVHAIAGDPRAQLDPAAGHARRPRHLHRARSRPPPALRAVMSAAGPARRHIPARPSRAVVPDRARRRRSGLRARWARARPSTPSRPWSTPLRASSQTPRR